MAIPIPRRPSGYRIGTERATIQVEAFVDVECPFSKRGWSRLRSVVKAYQDKPVSFVAHPIVLADHRQSWDLTKAATLMADGDGARFWDIFSYLFDRQQQFSTEACHDKTHKDVLSLVYQLMQGYDSQVSSASTFLAQLNTEENQQVTKVPIRYAISRGVWSTPTFWVNGAEATQLSSGSTLQDWQDVLNPLLPH